MSTNDSPQHEKPTLLLIDGFGLIFRAYHAIKNGFTTSKGEQVNAVYGFASMLLDVLKREQPDYAVIALEGGKTKREEKFEDYKAHRAPAPDDLIPQIDRIKHFITAMGLPIEVRDGFEADDVIGSLSADASKGGKLRTVIVTGDSDLLQLVDDNVSVVLPGAQRFNEIRIFDRDAVIARYGFGPELVPDYKALVGDTSDNIPGVPGIGEKTAKDLIARFGTVEEILAHPEEITPPRAKNAIAANHDMARLSLELATIHRDLDIPLDLNACKVGDYDREAVTELFRELEFRSLLSRLPEPKTERAKAAPPKPHAVSKRTIVESPAQLAHLIDRITTVGTVAVDCETTSLAWIDAEIVGIALAVSPVESFYIPLRHAIGEKVQLSPEDVYSALAPVLADPAIKLIAHHAKYDFGVLEQAGYEPATLDFETMLAAYLLGETSVGLKNLAFTRLGIEMTEIEALIGSGKNQLSMDLVDSTKAGEYACGDVEATFGLAEALRPEIEANHLGPVLFDIEQPLVPVLLRMERAGVAIDVPYLKNLSQEIGDRLSALEVEMTKLAGRPVNVGSPKQLGTLLFEELGLPHGRKTKTGYSVDADVLESLRDKHPIIECILEHRSLQKLKSTYVDALPMQVNPRTGRIHTTFNQTIAATGRLSSTDPNLQNIPIRTAEGKRVRAAFIADRRPEYAVVPDAVLVSADYSQIELRLLADLSGEPFLIDAFNRGDDIHRATAAIVHGIPPEDVTSDQRRIAKTVNFGVLYGMQAFGLARDTGLSRADAQAFIDQYWERLPKVRDFFDNVVAEAERDGYVKTAFGRRRAAPDLTSSNGMRQQAARRMAINMPLQGGAADIMKLAMIELDRQIQARPKLQARMLLQVHDELVLEVSERDLTEAVTLVRGAMEGVAKLKVPLVVEVSVGPNWEAQEDL